MIYTALSIIFSAFLFSVILLTRAKGLTSRDVTYWLLPAYVCIAALLVYFAVTVASYFVSVYGTEDVRAGQTLIHWLNWAGMTFSTVFSIELIRARFQTAAAHPHTHIAPSLTCGLVTATCLYLRLSMASATLTLLLFQLVMCATAVVKEFFLLSAIRRNPGRKVVSLAMYPRAEGRSGIYAELRQVSGRPTPLSQPDLQYDEVLKQLGYLPTDDYVQSLHTLGGKAGSGSCGERSGQSLKGGREGSGGKGEKDEVSNQSCRCSCHCKDEGDVHRDRQFFLRPNYSIAVFLLFIFALKLGQICYYCLTVYPAHYAVWEKARLRDDPEAAVLRVLVATRFGERFSVVQSLDGLFLVLCLVVIMCNERESHPTVRRLFHDPILHNQFVGWLSKNHMFATLGFLADCQYLRRFVRADPSMISLLYVKWRSRSDSGELPVSDFAVSVMDHRLGKLNTILANAGSIATHVPVVSALNLSDALGPDPPARDQQSSVWGSSFPDPLARPAEAGETASGAAVGPCAGGDRAADPVAESATELHVDRQEEIAAVTKGFLLTGESSAAQSPAERQSPATRELYNLAAHTRDRSSPADYRLPHSFSGQVSNSTNEVFQALEIECSLAVLRLATLFLQRADPVLLSILSTLSSSNAPRALSQFLFSSRNPRGPEVDEDDAQAQKEFTGVEVSETSLALAASQSANSSSSAGRDTQSSFTSRNSMRRRNISSAAGPSEICAHYSSVVKAADSYFRMATDLHMLHAPKEVTGNGYLRIQRRDVWPFCLRSPVIGSAQKAAVLTPSLFLVYQPAASANVLAGTLYESEASWMGAQAGLGLMVSPRHAVFLSSILSNAAETPSTATHFYSFIGDILESPLIPAPLRMRFARLLPESLVSSLSGRASAGQGLDLSMAQQDEAEEHARPIPEPFRTRSSMTYDEASMLPGFLPDRLSGIPPYLSGFSGKKLAEILEKLRALQDGFVARVVRDPDDLVAVIPQTQQEQEVSSAFGATPASGRSGGQSREGPSHRSLEVVQARAYFRTLYSDIYPEIIRMPDTTPRSVRVGEYTYTYNKSLGRLNLPVSQQTLLECLNTVAKGLMADYSHSTSKKVCSEFDVLSLYTFLREHLFSASFDVRQLDSLTNGHALVGIGYIALKVLGLISYFQLDETTLIACLYELERGYTTTVYHNSLHAADVAQMVFLFISRITFPRWGFGASEDAPDTKEEASERGECEGGRDGKDCGQDENSQAGRARGASTVSTELPVFSNQSDSRQLNPFSFLADKMREPAAESWERRTQSLLRPIDMLSLILAACSHDFGHTGIDNAFCINSGNNLALLYNDEAPLENAHAALSWSVLTKFSSLFAHFTPQLFREFRLNFVELILATDMSCHFPFLAKLRSLDCQLVWTVLNGGDPAHTSLLRWYVMKSIIKFADLSNGARALNVSQFHSTAVMNEFWNLGDLMSACGLTADKLKVRPEPGKELVAMADCQLGFFSFIVKPFWVELRRFCRYLLCGEEEAEGLIDAETATEAEASTEDRAGRKPAPPEFDSGLNAFWDIDTYLDGTLSYWTAKKAELQG